MPPPPPSNSEIMRRQRGWGGGGAKLTLAPGAEFPLRSTKLSLCASERALGKLHILQSQTEDILVPQCKTLAPVRANQF